MDYLIEHAGREGCKFMTLEVRGSNAAALALYQKLGFQQQTVRSKSYTDPVDDAVLMQKIL
jgi:ribosomal-protein-alanine N-acetyltransferase